MADPIVILLHGIRTSGAWQSRVKSIFEAETAALVIPVKYGYFDLLRFLTPSKTIRSGPVNKVRRELQEVLKDHPDRQVLVFAHSFGTYVISRILSEERDIEIDRLVLCGAVVDSEFDWLRVGEQIAGYKSGGTRIINECGARDFLPILASSVTWGFGSSGTFGMGTGGVHDRFHAHGHSAFFEESFVRKYWLPIIRDEPIVSTATDLDIHRNPWYFWFLRFPLKLPLVIFAVLFIWIGAIAFAPEETSVFLARYTDNSATKAELEETITELAVTRGQVSLFLSLLLKENVPESDWASALVEAKNAYDSAVAELNQLRALVANTPEIQANLDKAQKALNSGDALDLEAAQEALEAVRQTYQDQISVRRHEEDIVLLSIRTTQADLAEAQFERVEAANLWLQAANFADGYDKVSILDKAGVAALLSGKLNLASDAYQIALVILQDLLQIDPENTMWLHSLSVVYAKTGEIARARGELADARNAYQEAIDIVTLLVSVEPDNAEWQNSLSIYLLGIAEVSFAVSNSTNLQIAYQERLEFLTRLAETKPLNSDQQFDLNNSILGMAEIDMRADDTISAQIAAQEVHASAVAFLKKEPENILWSELLAYSKLVLADLATINEDFETARTERQNALDIFERLTQLDPDSVRFRFLIVSTHLEIGKYALAHGEKADAQSSGQEALILTSTFASNSVGEFYKNILFLATHILLAETSYMTEDLSTARSEVQAAIDILEWIRKSGPTDYETWALFSSTYEELARVTSFHKDITTTMNVLGSWLELSIELARAEPDDWSLQSKLAGIYFVIIIINEANGLDQKFLDPVDEERYLVHANSIMSRIVANGQLASVDERIPGFFEEKLRFLRQQ